jgi:hypothetical protein
MYNKLIFTSGPYRSSSDAQKWSNIMMARHYSSIIWECGGVAVCPHLNSMMLDCGRPDVDHRYLLGDIAILDRCDGMLMLPSWKFSEGARNEHRHIEDQISTSVKIFYYDDPDLLERLIHFCIRSTDGRIQALNMLKEPGSALFNLVNYHNYMKVVGAV